MPWPSVPWRRRREAEEAPPSAPVVEEAPSPPPAPEAPVAAAPAARPPSEAALVSEIAITIEEDITGRLSREGEVLDLRGEGRLIIDNRSNTPLLAVRVELKGVENTTIESPVLNYRALAQGERRVLAYKIRELPRPALKLSEKLVLPEEYREAVVLLGQEVSADLNITLKNEGEGAFKDIRLLKQLPSSFTPAGPPIAERGRATVAEGQLTWQIDELGPGEEAKLTVRGILLHREARDLSLGGIRYMFSAEGISLSGLDVKEVEAHGVMEYAITSEELETVNTWDVRVEFVNRGDLRGRARLHLVPPEGGEVELKGAVEGELEGRRVYTVEAELGPGERKEVDVFSLRYEGDPRFEVVLFEPVLEHREYKRSKASLFVEARYLPVLALSLEKSARVLHEGRFVHLGPSRLVSGIDNRVACSTTLTNIGTAPIRYVEVRERLPPVFKPPERITRAVLLSAGEEKPVPSEQVEVRPAEGEFTILIRDLEAAVGKPMERGDRLLIEYEVVASAPPSGEVYRLPSAVLASTREENVKLLVELPEEKAPVLETVRARRSLARSVSVEQIAPDQFRVTIRVENKGDLTLFKYEVIDTIPPGFELLEARPEPVREANRLRWTVEEFAPGQVVEFAYVVRGTGEYDPKLLLCKKVS